MNDARYQRKTGIYKTPLICSIIGLQIDGPYSLAQSFARPRVSDDNPFSEAQFKTLKYHRFFMPWYESLEDAKESLAKFLSGITESIGSSISAC